LFASRNAPLPVGIEQSAFHPLEVPQLIEECFQELLEKASAIKDPFEQAFFVMVQLPYLQPFDDVNKRVSRLAANIPLIKGNFAPLSFTDVPQRSYLHAILGVYELRRAEMLRDVFIWAYERLCRALCRRQAVARRARRFSPAISQPDARSGRRCRALAHGKRRRRPGTSANGRQSIFPRRTASSFAQLRRANCSVCTRAISRATRSGPQSSKPGRRYGNNDACTGIDRWSPWNALKCVSSMTPSRWATAKYVKALEAERDVREITRRIIKSAISVFDQLNDARNNRSFAYDNDLIDHAEARFIFDAVGAFLRVVKSIEASRFGT